VNLILGLVFAGCAISIEVWWKKSWDYTHRHDGLCASCGVSNSFSSSATVSQIPGKPSLKKHDSTPSNARKSVTFHGTPTALDFALDIAPTSSRALA
jgi:hypothetical protein